ncbi:hypothetical protein [Mesorhizobium sp.]|uniref:hypothetical protein n=1 Tax=Mesorhizobium sp. TaxID=1871066 RepID=UPI000FE85CD4|nr:hypothetical protein [Mesorhizobium sp.]RWM38865.1 MAG: hypothetical protein EOR75_17075 [Mesorhizobium sp.]TIO82680.1 MAG: hypothetical protein E5X74_23655 [Mesorhizobium sp.]
MRTLQAIAVMLFIGPLANSPALASSYDGSRNDDQATTAAASLPGLVPAGSTSASTDRPIKVAWDCPPGYVAGRYYRSCVPDRRLPHPTSTPSGETDKFHPATAADACTKAGLKYAGAGWCSCGVGFVNKATGLSGAHPGDRCVSTTEYNAAKAPQ